MLVVLEGFVTLVAVFIIVYNILSDFDDTNFMSAAQLVAGAGFLVLPFLRMDREHNGLVPVLWHYYVLAHYELIIIGAILGALYYIKEFKSVRTSKPSQNHRNE